MQLVSVIVQLSALVCVCVLSHSYKASLESGSLFSSCELRWVLFVFVFCLASPKARRPVPVSGFEFEASERSKDTSHATTASSSMYQHAPCC